MVLRTIFNSIKMYPIPHFSIIFLYSLTISLLNIQQVSCWISKYFCLGKTKIYVLGANNTIFYTNKRQISFNGENKIQSLTKIGPQCVHVWLTKLSYFDGKLTNFFVSGLLYTLFINGCELKILF